MLPEACWQWESCHSSTAWQYLSVLPSPSPVIKQQQHMKTNKNSKKLYLNNYQILHDNKDWKLNFISLHIPVSKKPETMCCNLLSKHASVHADYAATTKPAFNLVFMT